MLLSLPNEVIDKIARAMHSIDCARLSAVSWRAHDIAIRVLYWSVTLDEYSILPFLRTLFNEKGSTLPLNPFLLVRHLSITNRDLFYLCKSNPLIAVALSRMDNLQSLNMGIAGFSADVTYLFLSKTALIRRAFPSYIPVLRPIPDCDWTKDDSLPNLKTLTIAGSTMFLHLARGRKIEKIAISPMMKMSLGKLQKTIHYIQGDAPDYPYLRHFSFALLIHDATDIADAINMCTSAFTGIVTLSIAVCNNCHPAQEMFSEEERDIHPKWTDQISAPTIREFSILGDIRNLIPLFNGEAVSISVAKYFLRSMPFLDHLQLGNFNFTFGTQGSILIRMLDGYPDKMYYPLWRSTNPCRLRSPLEEDPVLDDPKGMIRAWNEVFNRWFGRGAFYDDVEQ